MRKLILLLILTLLVVVSFASAVLENSDLISYVGFSEPTNSTAYYDDANKTYWFSSGLVENVAGINGDGANFSSALDDYLVKGFDHAKFYSNSSFTVNLWFIYQSDGTNFFFTSKDTPQGSWSYFFGNAATPRIDFVGSDSYANCNNFTMSTTEWQMFTIVVSTTKYRVYVNGEDIGCDDSGLADSQSINIGGDWGNWTLGTDFPGGTASDVHGAMDEFSIWSVDLTAEDVSDLWNGGVGTFFPFGPPSPSSLNLSSPQPPNESSFNVAEVNFNLTANASYEFNCSIYIDNTLNQTINEFEAGENIGVDFNVTFGNDGELNYIIGCFDGTNDTNTSTITFFMDFDVPQVVTDFFNNSFFYKRNLTAQFNLTDNILLHSFNISIDDRVIFNITHIHETAYQYNLSWNVSNLSLGRHYINLQAADGHTATELKEEYDWSNGLWNDYMEYKFVEGGWIRTESKEKSIFDEWTTERKIDRYTQTFIPSEPGSTQTFIEESDLPIHIVNKPGYYKGVWIIVGNHWKDYVLENEPDSEVSIKRINDYSVEVTITNIKNSPERLKFESIGDLNTINKTWDFYVVNMTSSFDDFILADFSFVMNLSMDLGLLEFDISGLTPNVTLEISGTNFTSTQIIFNNTTGLFRKTFSVAESLFEGNVLHKWYFDLGNYTPELLETHSENQTAIDIEINQCGTSANHTVLNITYFDEVTDGIINASNAYQLKIFDGTYYYNQTDSFPGNETNQLCTNLPPSLLTYNWDMWGTFTLSEPLYITRIVDIDEAVPIVISNNPQTELSLFLIKTANSSTVTYNWFTSNFQLITGTMRVYQCNPDGSQDLIESTPVIAGVATANIELLTQPYSYDIIIGGQVFTDTDDYSRCHIESSTELTYFVDTEVIDIGPLIGLGAIPCTITRVSNTTVNMSWTANPEKAGYVEGCVIAYRKSITGNVEVLNNCSVEADGYSIIQTIPIIEGNTYIVSGELNQNSNTVICSGQILFSPSDEAGGLFSFTGLLAAFFLVLALILMYSGEGESQLTGAGIGIVVAWILGILNWGWIVTSSIILFLIIIALIGRHSRVSTPV